MEEQGSGYIKLELRDGGVELHSHLEHIGLEAKLALMEVFLTAMELNIEEAGILLVMLHTMKESGAMGKTVIDLAAIEAMRGKEEEREKWNSEH